VAQISSLRDEAQNALLAVLAGGAYFLVYRLNELFDPWALYSQGINLIFLPAGIKHIAILVARGWGALGCFVALTLLSFEFWAGLSLWQIVFYSLISTGATWLGIRIGMRLMGIHSNLENLRFVHLPVMDLITTAIHGFVVNAFFISVGMKSDRLVANALAMMFGDYLGSFIMLTCLWGVLALVRGMQRRKEMDTR
jgi:hypothetical protein